MEVPQLLSFVRVSSHEDAHTQNQMPQKPSVGEDTHGQTSHITSSPKPPGLHQASKVTGDTQR